MWQLRAKAIDYSAMTEIFRHIIHGPLGVPAEPVVCGFDVSSLFAGESDVLRACRKTPGGYLARRQHQRPSKTANTLRNNLPSAALPTRTRSHRAVPPRAVSAPIPRPAVLQPELPARHAIDLDGLDGGDMQGANRTQPRRGKPQNQSTPGVLPRLRCRSRFHSAGRTILNVISCGGACPL
jgi:hypothetical protein